MDKDSERTLLDRWPQPQKDVAVEQPWRTPDGHLPPDRAFFERLLDEQERLAREREERMLRKIDPVRWFIAWALCSVVTGILIGLLYFIVGRA